MIAFLRAARQKLGFQPRAATDVRRRELAGLARGADPLRVILGAGPRKQEGWIDTDIDILDATQEWQWKEIFGRRKIDSLLAEHVWEHLSLEQAGVANRNCFRFLKPGGRLRLAVPDGLHPAPAYREHVRPGGTGPGADDHKVLYDYRLLPAMLRAAGFEVVLLEYWDEKPVFHFTEWSPADGHVSRSKRYDPRNSDGSLSYTSLIVDAFRPLPPKAY
ncbi:MAG TPA: hypothetical protein VG146_23180 [Verrucomicrobiae bacterium]|nr:hypothetical protein [Verrucomicrobiae bacterium]